VINLPVLETPLEVLVVVIGEARVDVCGAALGSSARIAIAAQTVRAVSRAKADVDGQAGKQAVGDAVIAGPNTAQVGGAEQVGVREGTRVLRLVEPDERAVEAALVAQHLLERPYEVPVPREEFLVLMNVGRVHLMQARKVLVPGGRGREGARGGLVHETLDGAEEGLSVRGRVVIPLVADVGARGARGGRAALVRAIGLLLLRDGCVVVRSRVRLSLGYVGEVFEGLLEGNQGVVHSARR